MLRTATIVLGLGLAPAAAQERVERLAAPEPGGPNAYLVDAGTGLAVVDAHGTAAGGRAIAERVTASGRAAVGILVTHPHPDHVGGLGALVEATQATIFGAADTRVELGADTRKLLALAHAADPDTPATPPTPSTIVSGGETVRVGDLDVEVLAFGPSEASNATVYVVRSLGAAFVGDLLTPGTTPFLLEKRTAAWLQQLDELERALPADIVAYPGHGEPGPLGELVAGQRAWLTDFRDRVAKAAEDGVVTEAEADEIVAAVPALPPASTLPDLPKRNVIAVTEELAGDRGAPPIATLR